MARQRSPYKTGNGSIRTQHLYLIGHVPYIIFVKLGITGNLKRRKTQIAKKVPGTVFVICSARIPLAWHLEQKIHRVLSPFRVMTACWGKEWYLFPVIIVVIPLILILKYTRYVIGGIVIALILFIFYSILS